MDSAYLKEHVGKALTLGLAEISQKKPIDPIEYLSKWLRKHVENLKDEANEALAAVELSKQKVQAEDEQRRQEALLEEQNQIQNEIIKRDMKKLDEEEPSPPSLMLNPDQVPATQIEFSLDSPKTDALIPETSEETPAIQHSIQTIAEETAAIDELVTKENHSGDVDGSGEIKDDDSKKTQAVSTPDRIPVPSVAELENSDVEEDAKDGSPRLDSPPKFQEPPQPATIDSPKEAVPSAGSQQSTEQLEPEPVLNQDDIHNSDYEEEMSVKSPLESVAGDVTPSGDVDVHNEQLTDSLNLDE